MATNLLEVLTEEDKKLFTRYINLYGAPEGMFIGADQYLEEWAKSKTKLYHLLGDKLMVEIPYTFEVDKSMMRVKLEKTFIRNKALVGISMKFQDYKISPVYDEIANETSDIDIRKIFILIEVLTFDSPSIRKSIEIYMNDSIGEYGGIKLKLKNGKTLQIPNNMKPIRALSKIINAFSACSSTELKEEFELFRQAHSLWLNEKKLTGSLVISIHPLDFITMSDNDSGWQSCMNWREKGCYRIGTVEMMNSNNVVCTYFKSNSHSFFFDPKDNSVFWNNKKWRQLFYVTKDIICGGKSYPYTNKEMSLTILNKLRELAQANLHWGYAFGPKPYRDMFSINSLTAMNITRNNSNNNYSKDHRIIFDTKAMYNDILNCNMEYVCVRNKVKKTKIISVSGKSVCACCGERDFTSRNWDFDNDFFDDDDEDGEIYNNRFDETDRVICTTCYDNNSCPMCGNVVGASNIFNCPDMLGVQQDYCPKCKPYHVYTCPCCGDLFYKGNLGSVNYKQNDYIINCPMILLPNAPKDLYYNKLEGTVGKTFYYYNYQKEKQEENEIIPYKNQVAIPVFMCHKCLEKDIKSKDGLFHIKKLPVDPEYSRYSWVQQYTHCYISKRTYTEEEIRNDENINKLLWHKVSAGREEHKN